MLFQKLPCQNCTFTSNIYLLEATVIPFVLKYLENQKKQKHLQIYVFLKIRYPKKLDASKTWVLSPCFPIERCRFLKIETASELIQIQILHSGGGFGTWFLMVFLWLIINFFLVLNDLNAVFFVRIENEVDGFKTSFFLSTNEMCGRSVPFFKHHPGRGDESIDWNCNEIH